MNVLLEIATAIAAYAPVVIHYIGMSVLILFTLLLSAAFQYPEATCIVASVWAMWMLWSFNRRGRQVLKWYVAYPIQRAYHRIIAKPIRRLVGGIMAKWRRRVVADRIDDTLERLCYDEHVISKNDYRRISNAIGLALGLEDLQTRKLNPKALRAKALKNIAASKGVQTFNKVDGNAPRVVKVDKSYKPLKPGEANLAFLRQRKLA